MNVLAFFAHPDDETMLAGGLLALLSKLGHHVDYLICTRGEGGETGEPSVCEQSLLGIYREEETRKAVSALGGKKLSFLNYSDPTVGENNQLFSFTNDIFSLGDQLAEYMFIHKTEILITHGTNGEYGHPAHITVNQAVKYFIETHKSEDHFIYFAQANYENPQKPHLINKDDAADWVIKIDAVKEEKINAARAHLSQNALFVRRMTKELNRQVSLEEVIANLESYHFACGKSDPLYSIFNNGRYIDRNYMKI